MKNAFYFILKTKIRKTLHKHIFTARNCWVSKDTSYLAAVDPGRIIHKGKCKISSSVPEEFHMDIHPIHF